MLDRGVVWTCAAAQSRQKGAHDGSLVDSIVRTLSLTYISCELLVGHVDVRIVSPHGSMQLGRINLLAQRPFLKVGRAICWDSAPPIEHAGVDRLVDVDVGSVFFNLGLTADSAIKRHGNPCVYTIAKLFIGVLNRRCQSISFQIDLRSKRKSLRLRLLHHPAERSLSKEIGWIAASNICMGTYEPTLLNTGDWARLRF